MTRVQALVARANRRNRYWAYRLYLHHGYPGGTYSACSRMYNLCFAKPWKG